MIKLNISFYGMRRSGNHGIIYWLLFNFNKGKQDLRKLKSNRVISNKRKKILFYNDCKRLEKNGYFWGFEPPEKTKLIFYSLEDQKLTYLNDKNIKTDIQIILLRDILNLFASRIKYNKPWIKCNKKEVNLWINYAKECCDEQNSLDNKIVIIYNKWLVDKNYRDEICESIGIKNFDITDYIGRDSSFIGEKLEDSKINYTERYKMVEFPEEVKKLINNKEVIRLMKLFFPEIDIDDFLK